MWYIGQVLEDKLTGKKVVYGGFDIERAPDSSLLFLTPNPTWGRKEQYTEIRFADASVDTGKFRSRAKIGDIFFGVFTLPLPKEYANLVEEVLKEYNDIQVVA